MFRGFKAQSRSETNQQRHEKTFKRLQNTIKQSKANVLRGKIERSYVSLMSLENKAQKNKKQLVIFKDRLSHVLSPGHPSMMKCLKLVVTNPFGGFKYRRKSLPMLFDGKQINKLTRDHTTVWKTTSKVETLYYRSNWKKLSLSDVFRV